MEIGKYKKNNSHLYILVLGILFLSLDVLTSTKILRSSIDYIFSPIVISGEKASGKVVNFFTFVSKFSESEKTISALSNKITQLESQLIGYTQLQQKYNQLLLHSKTSSKKFQYIEASIFEIDNNYGYIVDKGQKDGVEKGQIVVLGNIYIGEVIKVDQKTSLVRRAQDVGSSLPVIIVENILTSKTTDKLVDASNKSIRAVAVGRNEQIKIENIPNKGFVKNGDLVLVSSPNIGDFLVLGKIDNLSNDSAAAVLTSDVALLVDLHSINYVYIRSD